MTDIEHAVEAQEAALDSYTAQCHRLLVARCSELVNNRPGGMTFADGATAVLGGLVGTVVHAAGAVMAQEEGESLDAYASRVAAFLVEGIQEAAPVFLAPEDEELEP